MYQTDSASRTANYLFDSVEDMLGDLDRINPGRTAGFDVRGVNERDQPFQRGVHAAVPTRCGER